MGDNNGVQFRSYITALCILLIDHINSFYPSILSILSSREEILKNAVRMTTEFCKLEFPQCLVRVISKRTVGIFIRFLTIERRINWIGILFKNWKEMILLNSNGITSTPVIEKISYPLLQNKETFLHNIEEYFDV